MPVVRLVLDAESTVAGYWSDGTADVEVTATLHNEGTLRLDSAREITARCVAQGDERRECREELSLSLPDGFAPASGSFTLRLPMGATTLELDYGEGEQLTFDVDVPERILGVDRDVWECYSDRGSKGWTWDKGPLLCGSMTRASGDYPVVEKWLDDVPIKTWATGPSDYINHLDSVLNEFSLLSGLEFEWTESKEQADFTAYVGLSDTELLAIGDFDSVDALHGWGGLAGWEGRSQHGEILSGTIWTKSTDDEIWARGVILHEAMHALVPIHHSNRPLSMMGCCSVERMSPMDIALIKLNYHPLVRPGMSMDEVRELIVFADELVDYSEQSPDSLAIVWRAYDSMVRAGAMNFRLSGGPSKSTSECQWAFGTEEPIGVVADTRGWSGSHPEWTFFDLHSGQIYMVDSEDGWLYYTRSVDTGWRQVDGDTARSYSLWELFETDKLLKSLRSILYYSSGNDLEVEESDEAIYIRTTQDRANSFHYWYDDEGHIDFTLVVDPETFLVSGYSWTMNYFEDSWYHECGYTETATELAPGSTEDTPVSGAVNKFPRQKPEPPRPPRPPGALPDPVDVIWRIYSSIVETDAISYRVSGGWCDGDDAFGKRRGPIRIAAGDFSYHTDNDWAFYDFHTRQFYAYYNTSSKSWDHFSRPSANADWEHIDSEYMTDYSSYWHWESKLSKALRFLIVRGASSRLKTTRVGDSLHIAVTFDRDFTYYSFGDVDTHLDLTLVVDPATLSLTGYTWKIHRNDWCSDYTEVATDFQLGTPKDTPKPQDFE